MADQSRGRRRLFGYKVADGFISYRSDNTIDFGFHAALDFKVASVEASLSGWIEARNPFRFNVDGSGKVCVLSVARISGEVTASSDGLAACVTVLEGDVWEYVRIPTGSGGRCGARIGSCVTGGCEPVRGFTGPPATWN